MIGSRGNSIAWNDKKARVIRIFDDKFRHSTPERAAILPQAWADLPESVVCSMPMYDHFATFLCKEYKIPAGSPNAGDFLSCGVVLNYLAILLNHASAKYKATGSDASKLFLTCLDTSSCTDAARWYNGMKKNVQRELFARAMDAGEDLDQSATPLYRQHLLAVNAAYSREGSAEAAMRKFALQLLKQAAGRSKEISWMTWEGLEWDIEFHCLFAEVPQPKVSKVKLCALPCGRTRHQCIYADLADFLVLHQGRVPHGFAEDGDDGGESVWLIPELYRNHKSHGSLLGSWLKALVPGEATGLQQRKYHKFAVECLPNPCNASGIRAGDTLIVIYLSSLLLTE